MGGLTGLGSAEFRLPVLLGLFALAAHQAVRLNLPMSLATLAASTVARFGFTSFPALAGHWPEILALMLAAMVAAWFGAGPLAVIGGQCWSGRWWATRCISAPSRAGGGARPWAPWRGSGSALSPRCSAWPAVS